MDAEEVCRRKTPLGLVPHFIVAARRAVEILEAMKRYVSEGYEVPQEWRDELDELLNEPHWKRIGDEDGK